MNKMSPSKEDLKKLSHRFQVAFALFCVKQVVHLIKNKEAHECIRVVELWLDGEATSEECMMAAEAVYADDASLYSPRAAVYAARAAAYTAGNSVVSSTAAVHAAVVHAAAASDYTAASAALACANASIRDAQWALYEELLSFDTTFEKVVLA